jgi:hypothetical protein
MSEALNPTSIDVIQPDDFDNLLYRVGNHEGKTAVAAIMLNQPGVLFGPRALHRAVQDSQGDQEVWTPKHPTLKRYCTGDFAPSDLVIQKGNGYEAKNVRLPQRLAFLGSVIEVSCDFPETSVQKFLGLTAAGRGFRSPNLRHDVCKVIADNGGHEMSLADILYQIDDEVIEMSHIARTVQALTDEGILTKHNLDIATDVRIRIVDPEFRKKGVIPFDELNPVTRLAYMALKELSLQGEEEIDFGDFRKQALTIDPNVDQAVLRDRWRMAAGGKTRHFPGVERVERKIKDPNKTSTVHIHPDHNEAVNAVLTQFNALLSDGDAVYRSWKWTLDVVQNKPAVMSYVFAKAKRFSASVAKKEANLEEKAERVFKIIQQAGTLSMDALVAESRAAGMPFTDGALRFYLKHLVGDGRVVRQDKPRDPSLRRKIAHYSVAPE